MPHWFPLQNQQRFYSRHRNLLILKNYLSKFPKYELQIPGTMKHYSSLQKDPQKSFTFALTRLECGLNKESMSECGKQCGSTCAILYRNV